MARAARGAGVVTAPNSILAGGPFGAAGFFATFLAAAGRRLNCGLGRGLDLFGRYRPADQQQHKA